MPDYPLWGWQGASGVLYPHSVLPFGSVPWTNVNYILVRREWDGRRTPLYVGEAEDFALRFRGHEKVPLALALGANEVHLHLLATSDAHRIRIETDLRQGHPTPLNKQSPGLGALAAFLAPSFRE